MIKHKQNDWFALVSLNDNIDIQQLADLGYTVNNSKLEDKDTYRGYKRVQELFQKEDGQFDEERFNQAYDFALETYTNEEYKNIVGNIANLYEYDTLDPFAPPGAKRRDISVTIVPIANPTRAGRGITSMKYLTNPTMTPEEVGQANKVFNWETQEFEDWTPNDKGGLKAFTRPDLVLAQYDEDTLVNGVLYKKGEYKLNDEGDFYYETLGNRSGQGKQFLHIEDTLTTDGSAWNKYDFMDSDGLRKSAIGTIMKTVVKLGPLFIPHVGSVYAGIQAFLALNTLVPTVLRAIDGTITNDTENSKFAQSMSAWKNWFERFGGSTSKEGQAGFFTFENINNIVVSAGGQLMQQKVVGNIPLYLKALTKGKATEDTLKLGRGLAKTYMVGTSAMETFDAFKEAGTSDRMASLGMFASMLSMYGLMSSDYLKYEDLLFGGSRLDTSNFRNTIKGLGETLKWKEEVVGQAGAKKWIIDATRKLTDAFAKMDPKSLLKSALTEGVEETLEEMSFDAVKGTFYGLHALGVIDSDKNIDFGLSAESMLNRYLTSFAGGSIGGTVFGLHNKLTGAEIAEMPEMYRGSHFKEIVYYARNGQLNSVRSELKRLHDSGQLGSTNLSNDVAPNTDGKLVLQPATQGKSQNDVIYQAISAYIDRIEEIVQKEDLQLSDDEIQRFTQDATALGWDPQAYIDLETKIRRDNIIAEVNQVMKNGIISTAFEDVQSLSEQIVQKNIEISNLFQPQPGEETTTAAFNDKKEVVVQSSQYKKLKAELEDLRTKRSDILNGKRNEYYASQLIFAATPSVRNAFLRDFGVRQYVKTFHNKNYDELSQDAQTQLQEEYTRYAQGTEKQKLINAHNAFSTLNADFKNLEALKRNVANPTQLTGDTLGALHAYLTNYQQQLTNADEDRQKEIQSKIDQLTRIDEILQKNPILLFAPIASQNGQLDLDQVETMLNDWQKDPVKVYRELVQQYPELERDIQNPYLLATLRRATYNGTLKAEFTPELQLTFAKVEDAIKNGNIDNIKTTFNQLRSELDDAGYSADEIKNLIKIGNVTLEDFIESVQNPATSNDALELFKQFLNQVKYENNELFDILTEELNVLNPENLSTYLIKDPRRIQQLQQLNEWAAILDSLLIASSGKNHNFRVNTLFNTSKLLTLDDNTVHAFSRELLVLRQKIGLLLGVSENNQAQKLQQHRLIGVNIRHKFLSLLFQKEGVLNFGNRVLAELGINQNELLAGYSLPEFKEENYAEIDRIATELESKIFELVKNSGKESQIIANILVDCFVNENDSSALHCDTTQFKATQEHITTYDQLMYFTTILSGDSMEFLPRWKAIIENPNFDKAPVFSHEYALRMGYSFVSNPDLFNGVINCLKQKGDQTNDIYLTAKSTLNNLFTILGGAGTGKTTLAKVLTEFFPNAEIKYTAATDKQITNLSEILDECEPLGAKSNLISSILGGKEKRYEPVLNEGNVETFKWVKEQDSTYQPFNPEFTKILILDEISLWDKIDLEILTDWASKNGVLIFGLGDKFQNQSLLKYDNKNYPTGMEDGYGVFTPDLTVPFRPENIAQQENYDMLYSILRQVLETNLGKPKELLQFDRALDKILQTQVPVFKYFENNGVFAGGTQIIPNSNDIAPEVKKLIEQCRQENKTIRIIVDATTKDKYASYSDILTLSDDVQGDEYDYVVIDKEFGSGKYERVKDIYTLTQRSRRGTIVVSSYLSDFKSELSPRSAGTTSLSPKQIQDFKDWRLSAISVNSKGSIPNIILPENTKPSQYNSDYKTNDQTTYGSNPQIDGQVIDIQDQQPSVPSTPTATHYISWAADTYQLYEQMNSQDRSDKYPVEVLKGVRDWIVYGHDKKTPNASFRGKPIEIKKFFTADVKLKPFSYVWQRVGDNTALCAQFNIDDKITNVPLVLLQGDLTNQSISAINFTLAGLQIGKLKDWRTGVDLTDTTPSIHYRLSQPRLLAPNKELTRESQNKFLVGNTPETNNVGRTFIAVSGDSWATPNEFGEFFSTSNEQWVVAPESNMRLIGVNTTLTAEEVISFDHHINGNSAIKFVFAIYKTISDAQLKAEMLKRLNKYLEKGGHTVKINKQYYTSLEEENIAKVKPSSIQLINNTEGGLYVEGYGTDLLKYVINDTNIKQFITNNWQSLLETLGWKYFYEQTWKNQGEGNDYWHSVENKNKSLILPRIGAIFGDNFVVSITSSPEVKPPVNETKELTPDPISETSESSTPPTPIETLSEDQIEDISKPSGESEEVWFDESSTSSEETVPEDGWSFSEQPISSQKEIVEKQIAEVVNTEGLEFKYLFDNDSWTYNIISVSLQGETQAVFVDINGTLQSINSNEETAWTKVFNQLSNDYDNLSDNEKAIVIKSLQTLLDNDLTEEQNRNLQPILELHMDLWEEIGNLLQTKMDNGEC